MLEEHEIRLDGATYRWSIVESDPSPKTCWCWADVRDMTPPLATVSRLNSLFISECAVEIAATLLEVDRERFCDKLEVMGASDETLAAILGRDRDSTLHKTLKAEWPEKSPLSVLGYRVGASAAIPPTVRRRVLERVFSEELKIDGPHEYIAAWGSPGSQERLQKIAVSIHSHCQNQQRRRSNRSIEAIQNWKSDLQWLKEKYYHERMTFAWPEQSVSIPRRQ